MSNCTIHDEREYPHHHNGSGGFIILLLILLGIGVYSFVT